MRKRRDEETIVKLNEEEIIELQDKLVSLGWLARDIYTPGTLDEATVNAISRFQSYCNVTFEMELTVIDPLDPMFDSLDPRIDAKTLETLRSADETYTNPNPDSAEIPWDARRRLRRGTRRALRRRI